MAHLKNKIRILVTHQLQFIKKADLILVLKDGKMAALQTYDELINSGLNFVSLLSKETKEKDSAHEKAEKVAEMMGRRAMRSMSRISSTSKHSIDPDAAAEDVPHQPKIEEETKAMGSVRSDVYWKYIRAGAGITLFTLMIIATVISQFLLQYVDYFLALWTNQEEIAIKWRENHLIGSSTEFAVNYTHVGNETATENEFKVDEYYYVIVYSALIIALFVSTLIRTVVFFVMCMRASVNLHNTIFIKVLRATMEMFDNNPVGRILNRFARDLGIIDELLPATAFDLNLVSTANRN